MNKNAYLKLTLVILLLISASLACNLPFYDMASPQNQNIPAPAVQVNGTAPTLNAPTASSNAASDNTAPGIGQVSTSSNPVYYGTASCGSTSLTITAKITDDSGSVAQVGIQYRYNGQAANAVGNWRKANMTLNSDGKFSASIPIANEAAGDMGNNSGVLEYQLFAMDVAGNTQTEPNGSLYGVEVKNCSSQSSSQSSGQSSSGQSAGQSSGQQPSSPGSAADKTVPIISNAATSNAPVYYNGGNCGPTTLTFEAKVSDNSNNIKSVIVRYRYNGQAGNAIGNFKEVPMSQSGGKYKLTVNIEAEANQDMNGNDGVLEYQITATDAAGNSATYPDGGHPLGVEVKNCNPGGVVSNNPPQGPDPITISNVQTSSQAIYYGICAGGEQTFLQVQATIEPLDQIASAVVRYDYGQGLILIPVYTFSSSMYQLGIGDYAADIDVGNDAFGYLSGDGWIEFVIEVTDKSGQVTTSNVSGADVYECQTQIFVSPLINYFNGPNGSLSPNDAYTLEWDTSDADCGVYLDGSQVNPSGSVSYNAPGDNSYQTWTHTLVARGAPCDNPSEVSEVVQVVVEPQAVSSTSVGGGSIFDEFSLDVGDGNGDDIIYDAQSSDDLLVGVWGAQLAVYYGGQPSVADCQAYVDSGAYTSVSITTYDIICYKTGSGNYGYLTINGMFLDLNDNSNSYIDISYTTEVTQ
jgi:hypothetical protein